ncbi:KGG domain-containing protein [Janthinobacterium sp. RB2R34]|uniref:KGG domain-containing protein n=1 Tax=Janthinobacterium sp. RB2R34 TaxID=3424193 RepID=UPI003F23CAAD
MANSKQDGTQNRASSNRGFAAMDPIQQREIAAEGGRAAHASGKAHEFTSEEARAAGAMSHKNDGNRQSVHAAQSTPGGGGLRPKASANGRKK